MVLSNGTNASTRKSSATEVWGMFNWRIDTLPDASVAEIMGHVGYDWVGVD